MPEEEQNRSISIISDLPSQPWWNISHISENVLECVLLEDSELLLENLFSEITGETSESENDNKFNAKSPDQTPLVTECNTPNLSLIVIRDHDILVDEHLSIHTQLNSTLLSDTSTDLIAIRDPPFYDVLHEPYITLRLFLLIILNSLHIILFTF